MISLWTTCAKCGQKVYKEKHTSCPMDEIEELKSKLTACEYSGKKLYREFEILENACEFWRKEAIKLGYKE